MHQLQYNSAPWTFAKFARELPAPVGPALLVSDLRSWWQALPGVAERHRGECPAHVARYDVKLSDGSGSTRRVTRHIPATTVWHSVPAPRKLAEMYAKAHGACVWVRADGDCFAVWTIGGKTVTRKGRLA